MEETTTERAISYLKNIVNKRKNRNNKKLFGEDNINVILKDKPADENGLKDIINKYKAEEEYLSFSRTAIVDLGKSKYGSNFIFNIEDDSNLSDEKLECLYKEGIYWEGTIRDNILVITINVILDIIQHMIGDELWLLNRIHNDIVKIGITVNATTEPLPNNWTASSLWTTTKVNYSAKIKDHEKLKHYLEDIGCHITNEANGNLLKCKKIVCDFRFTDTVLTCPPQYYIGSGCLSRSGQNVPMERKEINNNINSNSVDDDRNLYGRVICGNSGFKNDYCKNTNTLSGVSYTFRNKFPTIGTRSYLEDNKYIAKKYISFIETVLENLEMVTDKVYDSKSIFTSNDKYEFTLSLYLSLIHPKAKYRFILSLYFNFILMRTRGDSYESRTDSTRRIIKHGRNTRVTNMDHTGMRLRFIGDSCICKSVCSGSNNFCPHVSHSHEPLSIMIKTVDPMEDSKNYDIKNKCYPSRGLHMHYCPMVFPCKRTNQSEIIIKNTQLSMREKDPKQNDQIFTEETLNKMKEWHRQTCNNDMITEIKNFINSIILKPWDEIREEAVQRNLSYKELVLKFLRTPIEIAQIEKGLNDGYAINRNAKTEDHQILHALKNKYEDTLTAFASLLMFFNIDTLSKFSGDNIKDKLCNQKTNYDNIIADSATAIKFLISKKAASFLTTINNHFYVMSYVSVSGFRHKCDLNQNGTLTADGLLYHQGTIQNIALICSPDYIPLRKGDQNIIDDATIESVLIEKKNRSVLDMVEKEEIDEVIKNNCNLDIFKTLKTPLKKKGADDTTTNNKDNSIINLPTKKIKMEDTELYKRYNNVVEEDDDDDIDIVPIKSTHHKIYEHNKNIEDDYSD
uniref:Wsv285-like protein n=1 Tax=Trachysalambria curvirostris majanivirus TaxID=2984281 RepID=A0A9C7F755_9VIRU|nr:MAG: wsv285-like protein [Trachysalambria curvirostris majanivirus]